MAIHVGELHTDVVPVEPQPPQRGDAANAPSWTVDARWREAAERMAWLRGRVNSDGFDD